MKNNQDPTDLSKKIDFTAYMKRNLFEVQPKIAIKRRGVKNNKDFLDLTGLKNGNLTVIGLGPKGNKRKGARWICQCDCGIYTYRYKDSLLNQDIKNSMCSICCAKENFSDEQN